MSDDQFTKLFKYMTQRFDILEAKIEAKADKSRLENVYNLLDADVKHRETDHQERTAMNHQLNRHQSWFKQLAKNTNTKLVPEL